MFFAALIAIALEFNTWLVLVLGNAGIPEILASGINSSTFTES
ncbi:hypothetical protein SDC9_64340 [bioreactor metagenome]|uniref:Uncharacterized protein n=1 Tax=bioreactor metagenome TaxID=1076179 RepID=A0A644XP15_9ZZZZ